MSKINNLKEFLAWRGFGEDEVRYWARCFYKYTDCGPWAVFLMKGEDARTETHEALLAEIRKVNGQAILMNPDDLDEKFVQFLGFDDQGLSRKERSWDHYVGLVEKFIEDEKSTSHARDVEIVSLDDCVMMLRRPEFTTDYEAIHEEIYYEDIGPKYAWRELKCTCTSDAVPDPRDPQEDFYISKDPDPKCKECEGSGKVKRWLPTGEEVRVDPDLCVGIKFGSIVEGSDVCSGPFEHLFPIDTEAFDKDVEYMEQETSFYWERDNYHWFQVHTPRKEYFPRLTWDGVDWPDGDKPYKPLREKIEKFIEEEWESIPREVGMWVRRDKNWKPVKIPGTRAEIWEEINDSIF